MHEARPTSRAGVILTTLGAVWPLLTVLFMGLYSRMTPPDTNPYGNPNAYASGVKDVTVKVLFAGVLVSALAAFISRRPFRAVAVMALLLNLLIACMLALTLF